MRINSWTGIILTIAALCSSFVASAEGKDISEKEYWAAVYAAYSATLETFPRQETEVYEGYSAGELNYQRTKTFEYEAADKFHFIRETLENGKRGVEELFQIGTLRYCKIDSGDWKTSGCYLNPPAALEPAIESKFQVDKTEKEITYRRKSTFQLKEKGNSEPKIFLTEDTLVLNPDLSIRDRTIKKLGVETKALVSRVTQKNTYRKNVKPIEAPIK